VPPAETVAEVELPGDTARVNCVPEPVRFTLCGLPGASSTIVSVPFRVPVAVGLNVTAMLHWTAGARLAGQLCEAAKSPVVLKLVTCRLALPVLVSVTLRTELVVPTCCPPKLKVEAEREAAG
jgi:hypothetical protein